MVNVEAAATTMVPVRDAVTRAAVAEKDHWRVAAAVYVWIAFCVVATGDPSPKFQA